MSGNIVRDDSIRIFVRKSQISIDLADCGTCEIRVGGKCQLSTKFRRGGQSCEYGLTANETREAAHDPGIMADIVSRIER